MPSKLPETLEDVKRNKKFMICFNDAYERLLKDDFYGSCPAECYEKRYGKRLLPVLNGDNRGKKIQPIYCAYCQKIFPRIHIGEACPCVVYGREQTIEKVKTFLGR